MQSKRDQPQGRLILVPPLEQLVPADDRLRRLNTVLDLSFVHDAVRDRYSQGVGRPSIDPEVIIRLFLLQAIEGIAHVRELMRQVSVNLSYRWFIGYELDEALPDHSTLSKALDRFGESVFNELFERSIAQCKDSGLIEGRVLHVDATTIRADLDRGRVGRPDSPDPDARFGKFPGRSVLPGYKQHTMVDNASRVIVGLSVTPANRSEHDETVSLLESAIAGLGKPPDAVCGDAAYGSGLNSDKLHDRGVRLVAPPPKAKTYTGDKFFSVEEFSYDSVSDSFVCPHGQRLRYSRTEPERGRRIYRARRSQCRRCPLKSRCTKSPSRTLKVSAHHGGLVRLRADSQTDDFKRLYRSRAPVIEGVFGEAKQWHSLARAWRRGLRKMRIQSWLIAAVLNLKRLVRRLRPSVAALCLLLTIETVTRRILRIITRSSDDRVFGTL